MARYHGLGICDSTYNTMQHVHCVCVCACVRACMGACVRACVCVLACVLACVHVRIAQLVNDMV